MPVLLKNATADGPGPFVRWPGGAGAFWIDGEGAGSGVTLETNVAFQGVPRWRPTSDSLRAVVAGATASTDLTVTVTPFLRVDAGGHADFSTIGAAVDYATAHPAPVPERIGLPGGAWWIVVEPGSYWERPFTLPAHTNLVGTGFDPRNDTSPRVVIGFGDDSQGDMITFSRPRQSTGASCPGEPPSRASPASAIPAPGFAQPVACSRIG